LKFTGTLGSNYGTLSFVPTNKSIGLLIYNQRSTGNKLRSVYIDDSEFRNTRQGLWVDSSLRSNTDGFDDLKLTDSLFDSVYQFGAYIPFGYNTNAGGSATQSSNVYVGNNKFIHIYGDPNFPSEAQPLFSGTATGITIEKNLIADSCGFGGAYAGSPLGGSTA